MLDAEAGAKCLANMKQHEEKVIKCQALARGHLTRNKHGRNGKGKGKNGKGQQGRSELEQKNAFSALWPIPWRKHAQQSPRWR